MSPVVVVTRDSQNRPEITWYEDEIGYYNGDPIALISGNGSLLISAHASVQSGEDAKLAHAEVRDHVQPNVSRFATHTVVEPGAPLESIEGTAA